jgi:hypothetical protein
MSEIYQRTNFVIFVLFIFMAACSGEVNNREPSTESSTTQQLAENPEAIVQVRTGTLEKRVIFEEIIPQDNCNGTAPISSTIERSRTIIYILEVGGEVTINASGELGVPGIGKVSAGGAVAANYGVTYGEQEAISRSLTVSAGEGSHMLHTIQQIEYWDTGTLNISTKTQTMELPYAFRRGFGTEVVKTENVGCPGVYLGNTPDSITETQTDTTEPTNTIQPTHTPSSTNEAIPLVTPENRLSNTPVGSVLRVGEAWTLDGLSVHLERIDFSMGYASIYFSFHNTTGRTLFFHMNENLNVTMEDDQGRFYTWSHAYKQDVTLEQGRTYNERVFKDGPFTGANYFIISLDLPGIIYAQWRYN